MAKPVSKERVLHVLNAIKLIQEFMHGIDEKQFEENIQLQSAVQYQFLIIGEAIRNIENEILKKYDFPWHVPMSFRNFIIHQYHGIKMQRIYFATKDLDKLQYVIKEILVNEF